MQLPGFANWPVFKQMLSVMFSVMTFIFEVLESIGVVNVGVAIILFALFVQLCLLPFRIVQGVQGGKKAKRNAKLTALKEEYKERMEDEAAVAEMTERQKIIKEEYAEPKGVGCLLIIVQMVIITLAFTAIGYMREYVPALMNASEDALATAYSFLGMNLNESAVQNTWPNGLFALCYLLLHFVPGMVKRHIAKKKATEVAMEGMTEEEKLAYKESNKFSLKTGGFKVFQFVLSLWWPLMFGGIAFNIATIYLVYWIAGQIFTMIFDKSYKAIYKIWERRQTKGEISENDEILKRGSESVAVSAENTQMTEDNA